MGAGQAALIPRPNPDVVDTGSPPIPAARAWLAAYGGTHGAPIDMSQAVPGDPPPAVLLRALGAAGADPASAAYGPILGDAALRTATAAEMGALYGARVDPDDLAITAGCNLAFVVAMMAVARAGDAVIVPAPWYFNHEMTLRMLGIETRMLACEATDGFVPRVEVARALIDARVRAIVLVTPNNPTGAIYSPETIAAFAALAREAGLWLVLDETYRDFLPAGRSRPHTLFSNEAARANLVQLYSFSKAFGIPGHRLGAMTLPPALRPEVAKVLDCLQISAPRVPQIAVAATMAELVAYRAANRNVIAERADAFRAALAGSNGWSLGSIGAYFAYVRHPFADVPAPIVAERLARERGVLALPATFFGPGQERWLRFAFANVGMPAIAELPARLADFSL